MLNISYIFKGHLNFFVNELSIHVFYSFFYQIHPPPGFLSVNFEPTINLDKGWKHSTKTWLSWTLSERVADLVPTALHFSVYLPQRHPLITIQPSKSGKYIPWMSLLKQKNSVQNLRLHLLVVSFFSSVVLSLTPTIWTLLEAPGQLFWRTSLIWVCLILPQD